MQSKYITLQINLISPEILIIILNRPEVRNAINYQMMQELCMLWRQTTNDHYKDIRCIVLTGSGDKAFCAGADLKERYDLDLTAWRQQHAALEEAMVAMINCPIPIIAAVNGAAYGGGLELLLACDFAYAVTSATFAQSEVKLGLIPGAMGTQHLPQACGLRRAKELCFTAESFSANQAFEWGIVNKLCEPKQLLEEVIVTAKKISANAPLAIRQAKKAINQSRATDIETGYKYEITAYNQVLSTADRVEGIRAFNEKRPPKFTGN